MKANTICEICGNRFSSIAANAKYCSADCKIEGIKLRKKEYEQRNRERRNADMRERRAANKKEQAEARRAARAHPRAKSITGV